MTDEKATKKTQKRKSKKYIGVMFECCSVYSRIYINEQETAYVGCCPKCRRALEIGIDSRRGVDARFFRAR